jgi:hypothetical protein
VGHLGRSDGSHAVLLREQLSSKLLEIHEKTARSGEERAVLSFGDDAGRQAPGILRGERDDSLDHSTVETMEHHGFHLLLSRGFRDEVQLTPVAEGI